MQIHIHMNSGKIVTLSVSKENLEDNATPVSIAKNWQEALNLNSIDQLHLENYIFLTSKIEFIEFTE